MSDISYKHVDIYLPRNEEELYQIYLTRKARAILLLRKMYIINDHERGELDDEIQKLEEELRNGVYDKDDE